MKNIRFLGALTVILFAFACSSPSSSGNSKDALAEQIKSLETNDSTMDNPAKLAELTGLYKEYVKQFPKDPKAADYLFKAAQNSNVLGQYQEAVDLFSEFLKSHPDDKRADQALFVTGYIYENGLQQLGKAKEVFTEFLQKYPNSDLADDAKFSLEHTGVSAEELFEKAKEKAGETARADSI